MGLSFQKGGLGLLTASSAFRLPPLGRSRLRPVGGLPRVGPGSQATPIYRALELDRQRQ